MDLVVKSPYTAKQAFSTVNIKQEGTSAGFLTFVDRYIKNVYNTIPTKSTYSETLRIATIKEVVS